LDATQCISYLTIENKGGIDADLRAKMDAWIFGCDVCQTMCPWNERFAANDGDAAFSREHQYLPLESELELSVRDFNTKFKNSAVQHTKRRGYLRNVAVALGNARKPTSVPALKTVLNNEREPLVRGHAAWALGQIGGQAASAALRDAATAETDGWVREEIEAALGRIRG
jgi:epoxyqueuosine reductase